MLHLYRESRGGGSSHFGPGRVVLTIGEFGNSSAATIPLTLARHRESGLLKRGDKVLMTGVGADFTEGAVVYRF